MATLNETTLKKKKKKKFISYLIFITILLILSPLIVEAIDSGLHGTIKEFGKFEFDFNYIHCVQKILERQIRQIILGAFLLLASCFYLLTIIMADPKIASTDTIEVATGISIPVPVGNGQYGSARMMKKSELDKNFAKITYQGNKKINGLSKEAGLIVHYEKLGNKETIWYLDEPKHVILLGATGAGKTRRILMPSIWVDILAGVNMCITDAKGELYAYTCAFAKKNDYKIITMDLRTPEKSMHHNYMIDVVECLKMGDIAEAVDKAWDLVSILVGEAKGEKIWNDGESAAISATILIVAQDAPEACKNLTNVYYFLAYMCEPNEDGEMPINEYMERLPDNHPAKGVFQVARIAPYRTRASFFTSALATLRHFTNYKIAGMTSKSDYLMPEIDNQKTIIYLMVPDEKTTLYGLGSLYINQLYISLVECANQKGGRLERRFIFRCDEFGNFPVIPGMGAKLSAARSRNIFFELVLQDYQQLESRYKNDFGNIKTNSELTLYLRSTDSKTLEELSKRCGTYTIQVNSASTSQNERKTTEVNHSSSANMAGRPLLFPDEIEKIDSPDALLLFGGKLPAITKLLDVSEYYANEELELGDIAFNQKIYMKRHGERESRKTESPLLWGIWNDCGKFLQEELFENEKVSFL